MDQQRFQQICKLALSHEQHTNGIGTLSEKTVHSILKNYFCEDPCFQEVKVNGFVADICKSDEIIEIQTRNFDKLRRKLSSYLENYSVTIVYPIPRTKWIRWINPQSGEISPPRKSPKKGSPYDIFPELYKIKHFLNNSKLKLCIVLINVEDYRYLDGWSKDKKKGSTRCDCIPVELIKEQYIRTRADYYPLIPSTLKTEFTSKDFKSAAKIPLRTAQTTLHILHFIGIVERVGKEGRSYLYRLKEM